MIFKTVESVAPGLLRGSEGSEYASCSSCSVIVAVAFLAAINCPCLKSEGICVESGSIVIAVWNTGFGNTIDLQLSTYGCVENVASIALFANVGVFLIAAVRNYSTANCSIGVENIALYAKNTVVVSVKIKTVENIGLQNTICCGVVIKILCAICICEIEDLVFIVNGLGKFCSIIEIHEVRNHSPVVDKSCVTAEASFS